MTGEFHVDTDALDKDAKTWTTWSSDLSKVAEQIPLIGENFDGLAFSILPNAQQVAGAYASVTRALTDSMKIGTDQYTGFATTLTFAATSYREAEDTNVDEIAKSVAKLEAL